MLEGLGVTAEPSSRTVLPDDPQLERDALTLPEAFVHFRAVGQRVQIEQAPPVQWAAELLGHVTRHPSEPVGRRFQDGAALRLEAHDDREIRGELGNRAMQLLALLERLVHPHSILGLFQAALLGPSAIRGGSGQGERHQRDHAHVGLQGQEHHPRRLGRERTDAAHRGPEGDRGHRERRRRRLAGSESEGDPDDRRDDEELEPLDRRRQPAAEDDPGHAAGHQHENQDLHPSSAGLTQGKAGAPE